MIYKVRHGHLQFYKPEINNIIITEKMLSHFGTNNDVSCYSD